MFFVHFEKYTKVSPWKSFDEMVFSKLDMPATKHKILKSTFFKQVKQELAKELYSILVGSEGSETQRRRSRIDSDDSENESMSSPSDSVCSMELNDPNVVIPLSMVALVEYASTASSSQVNWPQTNLPLVLIHSNLNLKIKIPLVTSKFIC